MTHEDLAAYSVAALLAPDPPATVRMRGRESLTGPQLAARLSAATGRPVTYQEQDPNAFAEDLAPVLGPRGAAAVASTYRWLSQDPGHHAGGDVPQGGLPGRSDLDAWLSAQDWAATGRSA